MQTIPPKTQLAITRFFEAMYKAKDALPKKHLNRHTKTQEEHKHSVFWQQLPRQYFELHETAFGYKE
ncbi:hypothetical protein AA0481_0128 [Acetobacter orientalis NRIC 0481]|nr:hypothetical protein AA0481_0128 [Acetobacter orientalis NRIC 0481]